MKLGRWRLDRAQRTLSSDGETRRLSPRSWDVLSYLLDHRGELVRAETLLEEFWRGPLSDEAYVRKCIAEIRKVLDDDARAPQLLRTVPKQGYVLLSEAAERRQPRAPEGQTLAVLPFVNIGGGPDREHFSDGLTEEILNRLTQDVRASVIARTSSFQFKGRNMDIREIGRSLNAAQLLEGSVRSVENTVRITAQLIDAATGAHLWSDTYEHTVADVFAAQDEIAGAISREIAARIASKTDRGHATRMVHVSRRFTSPDQFKRLVAALSRRHRDDEPGAG